jgi:hypothetical protein
LTIKRFCFSFEDKYVRRKKLVKYMYNTKVFLICLSIFLPVLAGCGSSGSISDATTAGSSRSVYTGNAILSWYIPTTYSNGSSLPAENIKGYRIYSRTPSSVYNPGIYYFVSSSTTSVYVKNLNLPLGQYYFAVTTLDMSGVESGFSNEALANLK